jgi:hypothetical protein
VQLLSAVALMLVHFDEASRDQCDQLAERRAARDLHA